MIIKVTASDIAKGVKKAGSRCPVARALKRAGFKTVLAGLYEIEAKGREVFSTPDSVYQFIDAFDRGETVQPFSFEIPWKKPVKKAAKKATPKRKKKGARK